MKRRLADKTRTELMIEAQLADSKVASLIEKGSKAEFDLAMKDLDLKIKRVQRRVASIKTAKIRWVDTSTLGFSGYVRLNSGESIEIVSYDLPKNQDHNLNNQEVSIKLEYVGPYQPMLAYNVQLKKAV